MTDQINCSPVLHFAHGVMYGHPVICQCMETAMEKITVRAKSLFKETKMKQPMPACLKALIADAEDAIEGSDFNYPDFEANLAAVKDLFLPGAQL